MPENIHDKFFKENFSRQDIAADFIRETFPETLLAKLDLTTFVLRSASYVDPTLEEYFADIIYDCQYDSEKAIQIAILFEHKSQKREVPSFSIAALFAEQLGGVPKTAQTARTNNSSSDLSWQNTLEL